DDVCFAVRSVVDDFPDFMRRPANRIDIEPVLLALAPANRNAPRLCQSEPGATAPTAPGFARY
ncbi:MAG TPA: hypothetical protein VGT08_03355, partial [Terracidiphilus sp.]|nr:hypothetical protein [Terracidiphilus sp.]